MKYSFGLDWALIIGGIAIIVNGLVGRSIRNDVEVPLSKEERENPQPPTRSARIVYISFGILLCAYGAFRILK
jgi:hypothetical protein